MKAMSGFYKTSVSYYRCEFVTARKRNANSGGRRRTDKQWEWKLDVLAVVHGRRHGDRGDGRQRRPQQHQRRPSSVGHVAKEAVRFGMGAGSQLRRGTG